MSEEDLTVDVIAEALYELGKQIDDDKKEISELINTTAQEIFDSVQLQVEANERIIAQLLEAYQELTLAVEVIVWKAWGDSPEESADFKAKMESARNQLVNWIRKSANAQQVDQRDLAESLGKLFPTKSAGGPRPDSAGADELP